MKMWIARDSDNSLWLHQSEPEVREGITVKKYWFCIEGCWQLDEDFFPEVTFENSPQKVEFKLVEKWKH